MNAIDTLLHPRSIAVVGASADATKTAGRPVAYLQKHGYGGAIYPVNPRADQVGGLTCYPDIDSLPGVPDVGLVLVAPDRAIEAVAALSRRGTPAAIVLASGFGETGESGARRQQALKEAAGGMRLLGPNTIGLVNLTDRIMLCASGALEMESLQGGGIAVVSQSGGILGSAAVRAPPRPAWVSPNSYPPATRWTWKRRTSSITWRTTRPRRSSRSIWKACAIWKNSAARRSRRRARASPWWSTRWGVPNPAHDRRPRIPARWPGKTASTTRCSARWARSARRPSPICSISRPRWPPAAACEAGASPS